MTISAAADLQRKHELEGAPDPFPPTLDPAPTAPAPSSTGQLSTDSVEAFPSLAPSVANTTNKPHTAWSTAGAPRIRATASRQHQVSESFTIPAVDLSTAGRDGKPTTLGEVIKKVMNQHKVKIEASTNQKSRQTTFYVKSDSQKELEKAKRSLLALLSPVVSLIVEAPASLIPVIIGTKGAQLKQIRDRTGVKIDIPRKDSLPSNGQTNGGSHAPSGTSTPALIVVGEDEEPTIPITVIGPQPLALEAQALLQEIISSRTSVKTQRIQNIAEHVLPFIIPRRETFLRVAGTAIVNLTLDKATGEITVSGDREGVTKVVESIVSAVDYFTKEVTSVPIQLPKRQHRLLTGTAAEEIMTQSKCTVVITKAEDPSEEVTIWGKAEDLSTGIGAVMEKANSAYIHEFPLPGPISTSRQLLSFMNYVGYPDTLSAAHPGVMVYTPHPNIVAKASVLNVDLVGDKATVDNAVRQVSGMIGKLYGATKDVTIDWLVQSLINSPKNAATFKAFHENNNVSVFFPPESAQQSSVLLVYDPSSANASPSPIDKAKNLEDVEKVLLKMAKDAADVKTETLDIEKKWQDVVFGQLDKIIGEDQTLLIKFGKDAGESATEETVLVRGLRTEVERAVVEINKIVTDAKEDEILSSFSVEFEIGKEFVGRIVGAQGSGVNKLKETLNVRVYFIDEVPEEKDEKVVKKKKATPAAQKAKVKIIGRQEKVDEAKKYILTQVERLADETSEVLKIPQQYHPSLIGQHGKYVIRLEEKYGVKITFPRDSGENGESRTREHLKTDEVLLKGGKKGVAGAKSELLDAVEFEKENSQQVKFTVPTRSVARILGRAGATINDIKDRTGAQIDVDKATDDGSVTNISVRGTKSAIAEAKAAILEISDQVAEETTDSVVIETKFHRTLIGAGGQGLRELIAKVGGPTDPKVQAGLIRFPRPGEPSDEVRLRGEPKIVAKLKEELEKVTATLRDRIILGVEVPAAQHRALIGRGGQHLNDLQARTNTQVQFPGSRSYHSIGEPENSEDLMGVDPANIVKVSGSRAACEKAVEELKGSIKPPQADAVVSTIKVPLKYHHAVTQQGNFFRNLRSYGVQVEQSTLPQKPAVPAQPVPEVGASAARIDDDGDAPAVGIQWQVVANYQEAEEGESEWTFKAKDQAGLDKALKAAEDAIAHAKEMSHVGFLTLSDRSSFPRVVGAKGANVARLRAESGADITVSREDSTIVIVGSESAIETAKESILKIAAGRPPRGRRD